MADRVYTDAEVTSHLAALPGWSLRDGSICRVYRTSGWRATLMAVNAVGHLAEAAWHHPMLVVNYASVEVRLNTHDAGGITDKDFELARRMEDWVPWRPPGGALQGPPADAPYVMPD